MTSSCVWLQSFPTDRETKGVNNVNLVIAYSYKCMDKASNFVPRYLYLLETSLYTHLSMILIDKWNECKNIS